MFALRKLLYKPKRSDSSPLAQFYYADEDLCLVAAELDTLDGRKNPVKCAALVAQLRQYQDHVLRLIQLMMEELIPEQRASRDFRVKYPDDLIQDGLAGQLWFGAECLAAGSSILNREVESESMRPLAKSLTKQIDQLRQLLRDQSLKDPTSYTDAISQQLIRFDQTLADFELSYVSAMVPVKTMKEYDMAQDVTVLFSETVNRAIHKGLITRDMIEYYDPALMFTIPRLAIVTGLMVYPDGPLNPDRKPTEVSEMFRPFQSLLKRIRELLWALELEEIWHLERLLCNLEEVVAKTQTQPNEAKRLSKQNKAKSSKHHQRKPNNPPNQSQSLFNNIANLSDVQITGTSSRDASNLPFSDTVYNELLTAFSSTSAFDNTLPSNMPHEPQQSASVIINNTETGEARVILTSASDASNRNPARGLHQSHQHPPSQPQMLTSHHRQANTSNLEQEPNSPAFWFNLPNTEASTHHRVTISRSLSQPRGEESNTSNARPYIIVEDSPDSDSSSVDSFLSSGSDSSVDLNRTEACKRGTQLMKSVFGTKDIENVRSCYKDTEELMQKLFICISGVADQLQSNFAADLRNILKVVFELHNGDPEPPVKSNSSTEWINTESISADEHRTNESTDPEQNEGDHQNPEEPPTWIPDDEMDKCCSCRLPFTFVRRRHHCRNCGLIFCARCSSNSAPLPNYGYDRAVRICNKCYMYRINPFYMDQVDEGRPSYNSAAVSANISNI